ncbi:2904_t:CDS:2, partial [Entrophospora sp. SA101]
VKNKILLTLDIWTSENSHTSFLGVTCHYINDEWKLKHFLLDIIPFHESHSAENMVNAVKILLVELGVSSKELIDVLSPFYSATLLLSSSNYSTIGEFHFTLWTLVKNLHKQIEVGNTQYIVANSILYKLEQYFKLPDEAKMIASLLDPSTKCSTFTTDEITRTVTAIK